MQAACGIGRVGGLAIALGVGAAVATGAVGMCGVAAAAPAGDSASAVDSTVGSSPTGSPRATSRGGSTHRGAPKPVQQQRRSGLPEAVATVRAISTPAPSAGTGPGSPAESTASWVVLAEVRRTGRPQPAAAAGAAVSTRQPLIASAKGVNPFARFSNRTPTMAPAQVSESPTGQISGTLNAVDADGDSLTYSVGAAPSHGTVTIDSSGHFSYAPDKASAHNGITDTFTVTVSDAAADSHIHGFAGLLSRLTNGRLGNPGHTATRTVTVTVAPVNAAPTTTVTIEAPDPADGVVKGRVVGNDADGDHLSYNVSQTTAKGAVDLGADGTFSYTPTLAARHNAASPDAAPADRADSFIVTVADGQGGSVSVPITVAVSPGNAAPTFSRNVGTPDVLTGVVAGAVIGSDPNGDPLSYKVSGAPVKGAVTLAADGSFTYTPTALARHVASLSNVSQADGSDSFTVTVADGYGGAVDVPVEVVISPASITFTFVYGTGSQYWSGPAQAALRSAAARLASYVIVNRPVTVTFDVAGESNTGSGLLASAFAAFSDSSPGYYGTVVQTKVITGVDANGAATDSQMSVNFAYPWALGDAVSNAQYDFQSVAMHELVHTFGVITGLGDPSGIDRNWTTFDKYLATAGGTSPIGSDYVWNTAYTPNLTGGAGGLYFAGPNAEAAYGGPVPLYTPGKWTTGASLTHLDPAHAPAGTTYLMDPSDGFGPGVRVLTPVESGMLADLGYTLYQGPFYAVFFGFRLRRRRSGQAPIRARHCSRLDAR